MQWDHVRYNKVMQDGISIFKKKKEKERKQPCALSSRQMYFVSHVKVHVLCNYRLDQVVTTHPHLTLSIESDE